MSLLVKTKLQISPIEGAGIGCFADEFIPKGTKIWQFNSLVDRIYTPEALTLMTPLERNFMIKYCYVNNGLYYLCVDNARFFNHSPEPNTFDPADEWATYAARDIQAGEEIVSNYDHFGSTQKDLEHNKID